MTVHRFCRQMNLMRIKQKDYAFPIATRFNENVNRNLSVSSLVEKKSMNHILMSRWKMSLMFVNYCHDDCLKAEESIF